MRAAEKAIAHRADCILLRTSWRLSLGGRLKLRLGQPASNTDHSEDDALYAAFTVHAYSARAQASGHDMYDTLEFVAFGLRPLAQPFDPSEGRLADHESSTSRFLNSARASASARIPAEVTSDCGALSAETCRAGLSSAACKSRKMVASSSCGQGLRLLRCNQLTHLTSTSCTPSSILSGSCSRTIPPSACAANPGLGVLAKLTAVYCPSAGLRESKPVSSLASNLVTEKEEKCTLFDSTSWLPHPRISGRRILAHSSLKSGVEAMGQERDAVEGHLTRESAPPSASEKKGGEAGGSTVPQKSVKTESKADAEDALEGASTSNTHNKARKSRECSGVVASWHYSITRTSGSCSSLFWAPLPTLFLHFIVIW